ncbi:MAG: glycosyltransferase [Acetobacteraceae bacterium]
MDTPPPTARLSDGLTDPSGDPAFWRPTRLGVPSAWHRHVPFAFWLVAQLRPRVLVELGTHEGVSYAAFCEAVRRAALPTRCFAVDTWLGDEHAGFYPEQVYTNFRAFHDPLYADFSLPLRMTFDEAAAQLPDGEIDLLHIDGLHDYDSVAHDFATWMPKLSSRAVVLFHDTNERERGFGVWRLWRELRARFPGFEFLHGSGLGVLAVGSEIAPPVAALCALTDPSELLRVRERFATLGERWERENAALLAALPPPPEPEPEPEPASPTLQISVVIPLYNGAPYIERALRSVFAQTFAPFEVIVVNDGSTDEGPQIVHALAGTHPITLVDKPNGGQSSARNVGIALARGSHIALLDQDDLWYPDHLAALVAPFLAPDNHPLGWSYSDLDEIDESGAMVTRSCLCLLPSPHPKVDVFTCLRHDMFILPTASLILREAFNEVGGFDERLQGYEDDDLFLRIFRAGYHNVFVDRPTAQWRIHRGGNSRSPSMAASRMIYLRKLRETFPDDRELGRLIGRDILAPRFFPNVAHEYRLALESRQPDRLRLAAAHVAEVAALHHWRIRVGVAAAMPILANPVLARWLAPMILGLRPLGRVLLLGRRGRRAA